MEHLQGQYQRMDSSFVYPGNSIIFPLQRIRKDDGNYRLVAQTATRRLRRTPGISIPDVAIQGDPQGLDLRGAITHCLGNWAAAPTGASLILIDISNAYARIKLTDSNLYTEDREGHIWRLDQPVQGLCTAGTYAPHMLSLFFKKLVRVVRKRLRKDRPGPYIHGSSYSDNLLLVTDRPNDTYKYIVEILGQLLNTQQSGIITGTTKRTLGLRWKVHRDTLILRRPPRTDRSRTNWDYILGRVPMVTVKTNNPTVIYCDGVQDTQEHTAYAAAAIYQGSHIIMARIMDRQKLDQSLAESQSIRLAQDLRNDLKRLDTPIHTDSQINVDISKNKRPRQTLEALIIHEIDNLVHTPGEDNLADKLTREQEMIERYYVRRPIRKKRRMSHTKGVHHNDLSPGPTTVPQDTGPNVTDEEPRISNDPAVTSHEEQENWNEAYKTTTDYRPRTNDPAVTSRTMNTEHTEVNVHQNVLPLSSNGHIPES